MTWNQFIPYPNHENLGKISSIFLNENKTLIKRYFVPGGITVNGNPTKQSIEYINQKFETECAALVNFEGLWFMPELVEINMKEKYIIQKYYGPDLLTTGFDNILDIEDQVVEIFKYISNMNYYKINGSLSNMTQRDGQVIMFDFKYLRDKDEESRKHEEYAIDNWLSKISNEIVPRLKELL